MYCIVLNDTIGPNEGKRVLLLSVQPAENSEELFTRGEEESAKLACHFLCPTRSTIIDIVTTLLNRPLLLVYTLLIIIITIIHLQPALLEDEDRSSSNPQTQTG